MVEEFEAKDKIETFALGARGLNQYDGTVARATFHSIATHGNASIGIQVSRPVGTIKVLNGITTEGSEGQTLVKGVLMNLGADGLSMKPGGEIKQLHIDGGIRTQGNNVRSYNVEGGVVRQLNIKGHVEANGKNFIAMAVTYNGATPLTNISAVSKQGPALHVDQGNVTDRTGLSPMA